MLLNVLNRKDSNCSDWSHGSMVGDLSALFDRPALDIV